METAKLTTTLLIYLAFCVILLIPGFSSNSLVVIVALVLAIPYALVAKKNIKLHN